MKIKDELFYKTIRNFLTVYLVKQRNCSHNTVKSYRETINLFLKFIEKENKLSLSQISFEHLDSTNVGAFLDWLQEKRKCSISTRNQRLMAVKAFVKYASFIDSLQIPRLIDISKIPIKKTASTVVAFLSENALKALLEQPQLNKTNGYRDRFFMILMYDTAARCQELLDLKLKDIEVHPHAAIAYLTGKGAKIRAVPLMEKTIQHYLKYLKGFHPVETRTKDDYLFYTTVKGQRTRMSEANVGCFMKRYGIAAQKICPEIPNRVHPHQLRHTRAMHLYRSGMPLPLLAEFMGHANMDTTQIYAYADSEMKRAALKKANKGHDQPEVEPIWEGNENMIRKLYGLA